MTAGVLLVLDGWGIAEAGDGNAIAAAATPHLDRLTESGLVRQLQASGRAVGLPDGVVGNSEIGHLVIGAGRALDYDSLLVEQAAARGDLRTHPELIRHFDRLRGSGGTLHLVGMASDGRIHSDIAHVGQLLAAADGVAVVAHAITDGRDVGNGTAGRYLRQLEEILAQVGSARIGTVIGRNYAMDKSGNVELTEAACALICDSDTDLTAPDGPTAREQFDGPDDGWTPPTRIGDPAAVKDGDVVLFTNFRSDRTAPLADAVATRLTTTGRRVTLLSLAQYDTTAEITPLIGRADASGGLADALESADIKSVRIAEREKFEHVTFFLNGRDPRLRPCEEHVCVPGKADSDYIEAPAMHVADVASATVSALRREDVGLVVANLANIDVVGHTGNYAATVRAAEAVDAAVAEIVAAARTAGRWVILVGDHGNGEDMIRLAADGQRRPYGGHTTNPVPCVLVPPVGHRVMTNAPGHQATLPSVAPTVLSLLGVDVPETMTCPPLWLPTGAPVPTPRGDPSDD